MYEDLEPIANLTIGEEIDNVGPYQEELRAAGRLGNSGAAVTARIKAQIARVERICNSTFTTWLDLIERKNDGKITRDDLNFIVQKVEVCAAGVKNATAALPPGLDHLRGTMGTYAAQEAAREGQRIVARIRRKLEIRLREQEAFPAERAAMAEPGHYIHLNIQNSTVANLNLGNQVGEINNALEVISSGTSEQHQLAEALKQLTEAVMATNSVADGQKREAVQAVSTLAKEAEMKPEARSTGTVRAITTWLPTMLATAADTITVWDRVWPVIKGYFHL